jgi:flagellar biosynthesis protein FlgN
MTYGEAVDRMIRGMQADLQDYTSLHELLEWQFRAALDHQSNTIAEIAQGILKLTGLLESRRRERQKLATLLVSNKSPVVSIKAVAAQLPAGWRPAFDAAWSRLEQLVIECKHLNSRNCRLMMGQYEAMQRVLQADVNTYAPA